LQSLLHRLFPWQIRWKGALLEALILLAAYIVWLIFQSPASPARALFGSVAVLAPLVATVFLIYRSLPEVPLYSRRAWTFLGIALVCLLLGNFSRTFYLVILSVPLPVVSVADFFNFLAYPLILYALMLIPFENRYAPSRFRFFLDVTISSGVVATLGWLLLAPSLIVSGLNGLAGLVPLTYPIADLVLVMILINMLLANRTARRTLLIWGIGLLAVSISDYFYSYQVSLQSYQAGELGSLGWTIGFLLFGVGILIETGAPAVDKKGNISGFDFGSRLQNLLPVTLVLALFWYVLIDWQYRGTVSPFGLWMSVLLSIGLIVRLGVRAGESELHKYWQLFSSLAEPTFICDSRGRIMLGNPALVKAVGLQDEAQIIGKPLTAIFDSSDLPDDMLRLAARQDFVQEVHLQPDQTPYMLSLSPIASEGRAVLIAGVTHNLSDQKRQQNAIQKAYEELQVVYRRLEELNSQLELKVEERTRTLSEANRQLEEQNKILQALDQLKSDFVSMVSHELRTPLTSLTGGLELLLNRRERRPADRSTLLLMKNEVERLTRFVENILNLSAMEAGRLEFWLAPTSLGSLLEDICQKLKTFPGAERIRVKLPENLPPVLVDAGLLRSVFHHLIDNALKYAPEGPVEIQAFRERTTVRVQVTDAGPGIPREKRRLLFQRFQRLDAKDSQSVYGFGLGLYLSKRMLQALSSDLEYKTPDQGGSCFFFSLKVAK